MGVELDIKRDDHLVASAAAVYYYDVVANLDGKWKAYGSYSWYDYNYSRLCVRTYNSVAGAES